MILLALTTPRFRMPPLSAIRRCCRHGSGHKGKGQSLLYLEGSVKTATLFAASFLIIGTLIGQHALAATKQAVSTPSIECIASTADTITIQFTAGASGAAAGFSIQWMTLEDFTNGTAYNAPGQWPDFAHSDPAADAGVLLKASFSGRAKGTNWNLPANTSVNVTIGDLNDADPGVAFNSNELDCGTTYVFRAFSHSTGSKLRSDFTATDTCSTAACP